MQKIAVIGNSCIDFVNLRAPLLKYLRDCDAEIFVVGPACKEEEILNKLEEFSFQYVPFSIKPVSLNPFNDLFSFIQIYKALKLIQPDKVLLLTLKPIVYGSFASYLAGIKDVFSLNSGLGRIFVGESIYHKFVLLFLKPLLKFAFKFNKTVFSETPFYTGRILLCGDVINFSGVDDTVEHNFDSGSQKTISSLRVQFYYSSNNRLIPYEFRDANHILKLAVTCSTDKLENIAKVERDFSLPPPMSIPEMEDPRRWDAFISIFMVVATGLFLLWVMRKPKLIE